MAIKSTERCDECGLLHRTGDIVNVPAGSHINNRRTTTITKLCKKCYAKIDGNIGMPVYLI